MEAAIIAVAALPHIAEMGIKLLTGVSARLASGCGLR